MPPFHSNDSGASSDVGPGLRSFSATLLFPLCHPEKQWLGFVRVLWKYFNANPSSWKESAMARPSESKCLKSWRIEMTRDVRLTLESMVPTRPATSNPVSMAIEIVLSFLKLRSRKITLSPEP